MCFRRTSRARRGSGSPRLGLPGWGWAWEVVPYPGLPRTGSIQAAHPRLHTCVPKRGKGDPSSGGAGSRGSAAAAARPSPRTVPEGTARKESLPALGPLNCPQTRSCQPPPEPGTSLRSAARDGGGSEAPPPRSALLRGPAWAAEPEAGARQGRGVKLRPQPRGTRPLSRSPALPGLRGTD